MFEWSDFGWNGFGFVFGESASGDFGGVGVPGDAIDRDWFDSKNDAWEIKIFLRMFLILNYLTYVKWMSIILYRDSHGANIEALRSQKKKEIRLAPLFDHGLSFACRCHDMNLIDKVDVMEDKPVQCFVGGRSAQENLKLIPQDKLPKINELKETDREYLFEGLDNIMPQCWQNKIWEMIWKRWQYYESFCNQR